MDNRISRAFQQTPEGKHQEDQWCREQVAKGNTLHPIKGFQVIQNRPGEVLNVRHKWTFEKAPN